MTHNIEMKTQEFDSCEDDFDILLNANCTKLLLALDHPIFDG